MNKSNQIDYLQYPVSGQVHVQTKNINDMCCVEGGGGSDSILLIPT